MERSEYLYNSFTKDLNYEPTPCQDNFFRQMAAFAVGDDADIMVVNGYAGTGKTTAIASVIAALDQMKVPSILLAPTGRSAKVLSSYTHRPAYTIHKHIYRQKSFSDDGMNKYTLVPNKASDTLFVVDEVSLIGIDAGQQSSLLFGTGNLLDDLIAFVRSGTDCRLVLIGDSAQLPPVGLDISPALSKDYMEGTGGVSWCELTTVVRQKKASGILANATILRKLIARDNYGEECIAVSDLKLKATDFDDVQRITGGDLIETVSDAYSKYGDDETMILCRSNKRANRYNAGIRSTVQYKEEKLVRDDKLMIVKNCYQFLDGIEGLDYIANGDIAKLIKISNYEDRYGLHFAQAELSLPDYGDQEIKAKVILDTLESESAALSSAQQNELYNGVLADYSTVKSKRKRYKSVREDLYFNALQLKYANAITCHKSQGGQWKCVFIDNPFWQDELTVDDLKWLYTAITRAVEKVYLVNFKDVYFG